MNSIKLNFLRVAAICFTAFAMLLTPATADAQTKAVKGSVMDENGLPLPGATVNVTGSKTYATTDIDGKFTINAKVNDQLLVSFLGYDEQTLTVPKINAEMKIQLKPSANELEETVVVGYGTQTKKDLTGSVASISADDIARTPVSNVFEALNGKVPGMHVTVDTQPGGAPNVQIRGMGSFGDSSPICVIDGQFFGVEALSLVNSADIESLTVLKDASATAIYGSRGANGVIIVTTKSGSGEEGKTRVNVSAYASLSQIERKLPMTNLSEWQHLQNMEHQADYWNDPIKAAQVPYPDWASAGEGNDWQDLVTRLAWTEQADVSLSGTLKKMDFYLSGSYLNQQGVVKESNYNRFTARLNVGYKPWEWIKIGVNNMISADNRTHADNMVFTHAGRRKPDDPVYQLDEDGSEGDDYSGGSSNPMALLKYTHDRYDKAWNINNNIYAEITFLKNFHFKTSFSNTMRFGEGKVFLPAFMEDVPNAREYIVSQFNHNTSANRNWLQENTLTYNLNKKDHMLTVMAGCTFQQIFNQFANVAATELPWSAWKNRNLWYVGQGNNITGKDGGSEKTYASFFGRLVYSYRGRYTLTATGRYDGSSVYPKDNRFGFFPSIGLAWNISQESWMKPSRSWLTFLKLRASWGVVGNDKGVSNAQTIYANAEDYVYGPDNQVGSANALKLMIDNTLTWERARTFNVGIDFNLWKGTLKGAIDYYDKLTSNVMMPLNIQPSNIMVTSNIGSVKNSGFEASLTYSPKIRNVNTSFTITAASNKNVVTKIRDVIGPINNIPNSTIEGYPIGGFWGYKSIGVFQNEEQLNELPKVNGSRVGDLIFQDQNGDGYIDSNDYVYLGSYLPKGTLGFTAQIDWKGFGFLIDLTSALGHKSFNERFRGRQPYHNGLKSMLQGWTEEGSTNVHPRFFGLSNSTAQHSDYFIENCDYLSISNFQIFYNLPKKICDRIHMNGLKIYLNGKNLYTFTKMTGYTPEIMPRGGNANLGGLDRYGLYPNNRTFTLGFSINF